MEEDGRKNGPPVIRAATAADRAAVARLTRTTTRASYVTFLGARAVEAFLASGDLERYLDDHLADGWVAMLGGDVVGVAIAEGHVIGQLMVDHRHHRRGLGSALLAHVEARLLERHDVLELQSFEDNAVANRFYDRHGWTAAERRTDEEYGLRMIVFRKEREAPSR